MIPVDLEMPLKMVTVPTQVKIATHIQKHLVKMYLFQAVDIISIHCQDLGLFMFPLFQGSE